MVLWVQQVLPSDLNLEGLENFLLKLLLLVLIKLGLLRREQLKVGDRSRRAGGIFGVVTGDDAQQSRRIAHIGGERPHAV